MAAKSGHSLSLNITKVHVLKAEENRMKPEETGNSALHSRVEPGYNTPTLSFSRESRGFFLFQGPPSGVIRAAKKGFFSADF
jgi:hypothetical protein